MDAAPICKAKTPVPRFVTLAEAGDQIAVRRARVSVAYGANTKERRPGALRGQIRMSEDVGETPEDFANYLG